MKFHPKFPEYVAVKAGSLPPEHVRVAVLGPEPYRAGKGRASVCFDCPGLECKPREFPGGCPIIGVWVHMANVAKLRMAGHILEPDLSETTMNWNGEPPDELRPMR